MQMSTAMRGYIQAIREVLQEVAEKEETTIRRVGGLVADVIAADGLIHVFGTGHSHIAGEEVLYRAGGLGCFNGILDPDLMLHKGAEESTAKERELGYAQQVLQRYNLRRGELLFVISNSGVNAVPVEAALYGKELGLTVVSISSKQYGEAAAVNPNLGRKLSEIVDIAIDNHLPPGDALANVGGIRIAPGSTAVVSAILHGISVAAVEALSERGVEVPYYISSNVEGANEHNAHTVKRYKDRIAHL